MRTMTVEELHRQTGQAVRDAAVEEIVVTENGHPVAVLKGPAERIGPPALLGRTGA